MRDASATARKSAFHRGVADSSHPPPAPTNVQAIGRRRRSNHLAGAAREIPDHYNIYRNGSLLQTLPLCGGDRLSPRGTNTYVVAAADAIGNQNPSLPVSIQLLSVCQCSFLLAVQGQARS